LRSMRIPLIRIDINSPMKRGDFILVAIPAVSLSVFLFSIEPGIYLEGKFGVRSEIDVYVSDKDIEVTGQPIQTEIIAILKNQ
jgi:hypothetical protein